MSGQVLVDLGERSYRVEIAAGALRSLGARLACVIGADRRVFAVVDEGAEPHWKSVGMPALKSAGFDPVIQRVSGGETVKTWSSLSSLCEAILAAGMQRRDVVLAFGGGAVGDLTGMAASLVHRGMGFVQCPTTLLSMVDSSVGGKTAINTAHGKNMLGTFYQPHLVIADPDVLSSLPPRERACGWAEIIKIAAISDAALFGRLEEAGTLSQLSGGALEPIIEGAVVAKARIVTEDEHENGRRALLNFGHTFGHALETLARDKGDVLHGEAVAVGMCIAVRYAQMTGTCDATIEPRITRLLKSAGAPVAPLSLTMFSPGAGAMLAHMQRDKKNAGNSVTLILPRAIGTGDVHREAQADRLLSRLETILSSHHWPDP
jgi:3-dehydroquinate synthase